MADRRLSPDVSDVAVDAHRPQRAKGEADHERDQVIEGWGGKHRQTPEAGIRQCAIAAAERQAVALLRRVI